MFSTRLTLTEMLDIMEKWPVDLSSELLGSIEELPENYLWPNVSTSFCTLDSVYMFDIQKFSSKYCKMCKGC